MVHAIFTQISAPSPSRYYHVHIVFGGGDAQFFRAIKCHGSEITRLQCILFYHLDVGMFDLLWRVRQGHANDFGRVEQAFGVFLQTENGRALCRFIRTHAFKHTHAIMQRMG